MEVLKLTFNRMLLFFSEVHRTHDNQPLISLREGLLESLRIVGFSMNI